MHCFREIPQQDHTFGCLFDPYDPISTIALNVAGSGPNRSVMKPVHSHGPSSPASPDSSEFFWRFKKSMVLVAARPLKKGGLELPTSST